MTLDISKTFDTLYRNILIDLKIKKDYKPKRILEIVLNIYRKINLNIDNEIIQPEKGVP